MAEKPAGKVEHYYPKAQAAAVRLTKKVKLGDEVHIVGHGDDFTEKVTSLQLDRQPIEEGQPGQSVGLWVKDRVHEGDDVLLVEPDDGPAQKPAPRKAPAKPAKKRKAAGAKAAKPRRKVATATKGARKAPKAARRKGAKRAPKRGKAARAAKPAKRSRKAGKAAKKRR